MSGWRVFPADEAPEPADGYAVAVFAGPIDPARLRALIGNPLATDDTQED